MQLVRFTAVCWILVSVLVLPQGARFGISLSGNYTTSSKVYPTPYSSDLSLRNGFYPLDDFYNPSAEIFWNISPDLELGLSFEYMRVTADNRFVTVFDGFVTRSLRVTDGFELYPIELNLYYRLPFSLDDWGFYIYGGAGLYPASFVREMGSAELKTVDQQSGYGIQVGVSGDYVAYKNLLITYGMKFRDPQVLLKSGYVSEEFTYNNRQYKVGQSEFDSKINVDGVVFMMGVRYNFMVNF
ncbi:MAG: hypothetical protein HRU80_12920 [Ignavibacteriales bacterium]|nr:hypothetical protein [Ignavibacteriaceae bacterium]QOJ29724.1 MAG: hypothetical protein HRU80_12920 [Ignavibacteriales bacterium]